MMNVCIAKTHEQKKTTKLNFESFIFIKATMSNRFDIEQLNEIFESQKKLILELTNENHEKYGAGSIRDLEIENILHENKIARDFLDSKIFIDYDKPKLFKVRQRIKYDYSMDIECIGYPLNIQWIH